MIWFTADQHFAHTNIIDFSKRPFRNADKMDQTIIHRYRKVVEPGDTVYFVGDLTIKGPQYRGYLEYIVGQLPGRKILVLGNHDKFDPFVYIDVGFESVHTSLVVKDDAGMEYILNHDPAATIIDPGKRWLTAHVHILWKKIKNAINIGVDQWEFFPTNFEEIKKLNGDIL